VKKEKGFRWLHINKFQVIFLQETYSSSEIEKLWSAEWGGKTLFCHGSKDSKGTVIMFNPLTLKLLNTQSAKKEG